MAAVRLSDPSSSGRLGISKIDKSPEVRKTRHTHVPREPATWPAVSSEKPFDPFHVFPISRLLVVSAQQTYPPWHSSFNISFFNSNIECDKQKGIEQSYLRTLDRAYFNDSQKPHVSFTFSKSIIMPSTPPHSINSRNTDNFLLQTRYLICLNTTLFFLSLFLSVLSPFFPPLLQHTETDTCHDPVVVTQRACSFQQLRRVNLPVPRAKMKEKKERADIANRGSGVARAPFFSPLPLSLSLFRPRKVTAATRRLGSMRAQMGLCLMKFGPSCTCHIRSISDQRSLHRREHPPRNWRESRSQELATDREAEDVRARKRKRLIREKTAIFRVSSFCLFQVYR